VIAMRQNPPKPKLPRKLSAAMDLGLDGVGRVETDAHGPSDPAEEEPPQAPNRASRRGRKPGRQPTAETTYEVGYCRPPKHTQFKPGQSGNPKGRSPQTHNFKTMVNKVVGEQVEIREGRKIRWMSKIEALFRTMMSRAFKGDPKAMASFIAMMKHSGYGAEAAESGPELLQGVDHEAILKEYMVRAALEDPIEVDSASDDSTEPPPNRGKA
jgi:Family of unknown function (DUF5681)